MLLKQLDYDQLFLCNFQYSVVTCRTVPGRATSVSQGGRPGQQDFVSYTGQVSTKPGPSRQYHYFPNISLCLFFFFPDNLYIIKIHIEGIGSLY